MDYKCFGAILIIAGCGGFGFSLAAAHRREESALEQLISALDYMACELQYRSTPLPELCLCAGQERRGIVGNLLADLGTELASGMSSSPGEVIRNLLLRYPELPSKAGAQLQILGESLGRFDLPGQLSGLESVRASSRGALDNLRKDRDVRIRSYHTLGLCAGAALAVLLI